LTTRNSAVSEYTERDLIARIQQRLPPAPDWLLVGIGDDAAVVEPERNRVEVLSVDAIVEGVHFDRAFVPPEAIGHRALAVNLSDLAAMGAAPRLALLSLALPRDLQVAVFDGIADGLAALAARHRVHIVGGNLTSTAGPLTIDITVIGTVKRRQAMTRDGARAGDELYVSGSIGSAGAGLELLREDSGRQTDDLGLTTAYLRPEPRVRLGLLLGRNRAASACVDLSDGLADGLHRIAEASGVGVAIDEDKLPIDQAARRLFDRRGVDPTVAAMSAGDDYELLFTARPRLRHRLGAALRHGGAPLTRIGVCTERRDLTIARSDSVEPIASGYRHFR
jgi:thiamine-monophosphate kinase